jgi:formiminoglutamase
MPDRLPVLISIPHGGDQIPPEVENRVQLTERDIFFDGDALTREIYNFEDRVEAFIEMPIARAIIDLNRSHDDRPPENPDGVVKTITTDKTQIYKQDMFPDDSFIEHLLEKYYLPFHNEVDQLLDRHEIILALDCHSMLEKAPVISKVSQYA